MKILGIDPGCTGAIAILDTADGEAHTFDTPVTTGKINGKNRTLYQPDAMIDLIRQCLPIDLAVIEHQQVMGKEGVVSAFSIGYGYALWIMALVSLKIPREIIKPIDWKRIMLQGRDKELSRQRAIELFPGLSGELKLKKHHGRAEALLLCEYGRRLWK